MKWDQRVLSSADAQAADHATIQGGLISGEKLMARAGKFAADRAFELLTTHHLNHCQIFCGKGNNGGDGYVTAYELFLRGIQTDVFILPTREEIKGDALFHYLRMNSLGIQPAHIQTVTELQAMLQKNTVWIDALLGTGLNRSVEGTVREWLELLIQQYRKQPILAIDIPSGIDGSNGLKRGPVLKANITATMGFYKYGNLLQDGRTFGGQIKIADLNYPEAAFENIPAAQLITHECVAESCVPLKLSAHKYSAGQVTVIGGQHAMSGAVTLAAAAALRSGAGMVHTITPKSVETTINFHSLETITHSADELFLTPHSLYYVNELSPRTNAWVIGPGLGRHASSREFLAAFLQSRSEPIVLDADALMLLDKPMLEITRKQWILTPHTGEFAALSKLTPQEISENPVRAAKNFAASYGVILHLKGAASITALPDGETFIHTAGVPGLATAGSGDVLSGIFGGLLAQGFPLRNTAIIAPWLHEKAAAAAVKITGNRGLIASDIIQYLPTIMRDYETID